MATARKPQDHKAKAPANAPVAEQAVQFQFTHQGVEYELKPHEDVLTAGYARKNRHKTLDDQFFSMLELLADDDALAAIDGMKKPEFVAFQKDFFGYIGVDLGESEA